MTISVNRDHQYVVVQQTTSSTSDQKINRVHQFVAIQQTQSTTDTQKINRIHQFVVVQYTAPPAVGGGDSLLLLCGG